MHKLTLYIVFTTLFIRQTSLGHVFQEFVTILNPYTVTTAWQLGTTLRTLAPRRTFNVHFGAGRVKAPTNWVTILILAAF